MSNDDDALRQARQVLQQRVARGMSRINDIEAERKELEMRVEADRQALRALSRALDPSSSTDQISAFGVPGLRRVAGPKGRVVTRSGAVPPPVLEAIERTGAGRRLDPTGSTAKVVELVYNSSVPLSSDDLIEQFRSRGWDESEGAILQAARRAVEPMNLIARRDDGKYTRREGDDA